MPRIYINQVMVLPLLALLFVACGGDAEHENATEIRAATATRASTSNPATPDESTRDASTADASALSASASDARLPQSGGALCLAHGVAASQCFICDAALRDPERLWCSEHARYEDRCFVCHPELEDRERLFCEEHGLYEDECFLCHPELRIEEASANSREIGRAAAADGAADGAPTDGIAATHTLFCNEHDVPEVECGICQPALADGLRPGQSLKIRLPSLLSETQAHIVARRPQHGPAQSSVHAVGQFDFNQNRLAHITPRTGGVVRRVHVDLGQEVKRGQVLAELSSPQIAEAKAALLKAVAEETVSSEALSRERELFQKQLLPARDLYDAEARHATARASLRAAEQVLLDLAFDRQSLERIVSAQEATSVLSLRAPFAGTLIERDAVVGDVVTVGKPMFAVADLSTLWLSLAVSEKAIVDVRVGHFVAVHSATLDRNIAGQITWISSQLDETTRMVAVRAEVANPERSLRAGMFVDADIIVGESTASLLVPRDAVYRFGGKTFVFVRVAGDLYELRRVDTRPASETLTAVTAGLRATDLVAVEQSYLLKSEFQKSRLGAGCVE